MINRIDFDTAIETHKDRPAAKCRCCGKTALHDGARLKRIKVPWDVYKWQCEAPCEKNKKKKTVSVKKSNNRVMIGQVWCNSLLERLSGQLSTRTVSFEPKGERSKESCPSHYAFDLMIPLAHAKRAEPLGWIIFGAKYMHNEVSLDELRHYAIGNLAGYQHRGDLANIVANKFCFGIVISRRELRRTLDLTRGTESVYHVTMERILSNLHAVEENYAREVKKYL